MSPEREPAAVLREALAAEARTITASPVFTERVIGAAQAAPTTVLSRVPATDRVPATGPSSAGPRSAEDGSSTDQPGWRGWLLPAAAAAVVAVLLAAALVGASLLRPDHQPPTGQLSPPPSASAPTANTTGTPSPTGTPGRTSTPSPSGSPSTPVQGLPTGGPVPAGFRAVDLTWVSTDIGYALGTAPCATAPCTSITRTTDGGRSWVGIPAPKAMLSQTDTCSAGCDLVSGLRFANAQVGYAFGPNSLFLTTDGGKTWHKQQGGSAYSLEVVRASFVTLPLPPSPDHWVLRVSGQAPSCAPGCAFTVQRASIGGDEWQDMALPSGGQSAGAQLAASGTTVVLATFGNPAGGAENATSVLFTSTDSGVRWHKVGEPCPRVSGGPANGEVDTVAVTVAPDGSITGLCAPRGGGAKFTVTSTDGGAHFTAAPASLGAAAGNVLGAASSTTLLVSLDQLYRSTDGGRHWQRTDAGGKGPGAASWIGFENPSVGRVLEVAGPGEVASATVWTTTDAGRTWTASTFR